MNSNNKIGGTLLKVLLGLILVLSFLQVKMKYGWDPVKEYVARETAPLPSTIGTDKTQDSLVSNIPLEVFNALQTEGYLCIKEDSNLIVNYFITKDRAVKEDVEWEKCKTINSSDTLFPKSNCFIFLRAKLKNSEKEDAYSEQIFSFDFPEFINYLIKTGTKSSILHELFSFSNNNTLTISYDNSDEYECKKNTDKGRIENMILGIRDDEYYVDSVTLYSDTNIYSNVMSSSYPSIKFINCKSK
jgi:hypothetical protein